MIYLTPTKIPKKWQAVGEAMSIPKKNPIKQSLYKTNVLECSHHSAAEGLCLISIFGTWDLSNTFSLYAIEDISLSPSEEM